ALGFSSAQAQMATQKGITTEELNNHVRELAQNNHDASKAASRKEAEVMAKNKNESFVNLAARAYEAAGDTEKAEEINKNILKRFPKGMAARSKAADAIFRNEEATAAELEQEYQKWIKQYPRKAFNESNAAMLYDYAAYYVGQRYAKENNMPKLNEYLTIIEMSAVRVDMISTVAPELLKNNQHPAALSLLEEAYTQTQAAVHATDADTDTKRIAQYDGRIASLYGNVLLAAGQTDRAVEILQKVNASRPSPETSLALAKGWTAQGQERDAFLLLQD